MSSQMHLNYDELLQGVVDDNDLASERRAHLKECPFCRQSAERIQGRLMRIGRMANQTAPLPRRHIRFPQHAYGGRRSLKPVWAFGLMAALLLAVLFWQSPWGGQLRMPQMALPEVSQDIRLMESVDALVADALPPAYQRIGVMNLPLDEVDSDQEMLDWVVPFQTEDDDFPS